MKLFLLNLRRKKKLIRSKEIYVAVKSLFEEISRKMIQNMGESADK